MGSPSGDVDDAFAIAALVRSGIAIAAIASVAGNTPEPRAFENNRRLAEVLGWRGPLLRGGAEARAALAARDRDRRREHFVARTLAAAVAARVQPDEGRIGDARAVPQRRSADDLPARRRARAVGHAPRSRRHSRPTRRVSPRRRCPLVSPIAAREVHGPLSHLRPRRGALPARRRRLHHGAHHGRDAPEHVHRIRSRNAAGEGVPNA